MSIVRLATRAGREPIVKLASPMGSKPQPRRSINISMPFRSRTKALENATASSPRSGWLFFFALDANRPLAILGKQLGSNAPRKGNNHSPQRMSHVVERS